MILEGYKATIGVSGGIFCHLMYEYVCHIKLHNDCLSLWVIRDASQYCFDLLSVFYNGYILPNHTEMWSAFIVDNVVWIWVLTPHVDRKSLGSERLNSEEHICHGMA